jgi:hypothetical protein
MLGCDINKLFKKRYSVEAVCIAGIYPPFRAEENVFYQISLSVSNNILSCFKFITAIILCKELKYDISSEI